MSVYCYNCMLPIEGDAASCPHCGKPPRMGAPPHQLKPGTLLRDRYLIGRALGQGGFGITYIGLDTTLDLRVAIKEFYPNGYAYRDHDLTHAVTVTDSGTALFRDGKQKFLREARILARFNEEPGIVSVHDFFEENNTAYIVMEYLDGITLKRFVNAGGNIPFDILLPMMKPLIRALGKVHEQGIIHRDISPDNIVVLPGNFLKLLDFGAAREIGGDKSLSVMLKPGYAPEEQYRSRGRQGPWTDVYALCATMYYCLTGKRPEESVERAMNPDSGLITPSELGAKITPEQENVILHGMAVRNSERYQSMQELEEALDSANTPEQAGVIRTVSSAEAPETEESEDGHTDLIKEIPREFNASTVFSPETTVSEPRPDKAAAPQRPDSVTQKVEVNSHTQQVEQHAKPEEKHKNPRKKPWILLSTLALCAALGVGGTLYLRDREEPPDEPTPTPVSTTMPESSEAPDASPTAEPDAAPTAEPDAAPTAEPDAAPAAEPTPAPAAEPDAAPTAEPTPAPTAESTPAPAAEPTPAPAAEPDAAPTAEPDAAPTAEPTPAPTAEPTPAPTPAPRYAHSEFTDQEYSYEDLLLGHWGEQEAIHNGKTSAYYLNTPVKDCSELGMELTIVSYEGYPFGDWALYLMDMSGNWNAAVGFKLEKYQGDGRTCTYALTFDKPQSFQALTICPAEKGMEQTINRVLLFYCEQQS